MLVGGRVGQLGGLAKPLVVLGMLLILLAIFGWTGRLARRAWWAPLPVYAVLAAIGTVAVLLPASTSSIDLVPVLVGLVTWLFCLSLLTDPLRRGERIQARAARTEGAGSVAAQDPGLRGAGDISFVCNGRLACLHGLGALGGQPHAPGADLEVDSIAVQVRRAALLFHRLTR